MKSGLRARYMRGWVACTFHGGDGTGFQPGESDYGYTAGDADCDDALTDNDRSAYRRRQMYWMHSPEIA